VVIGAITGFGLGLLFSLIGTPLVGCLAGLAGGIGGVLLVEWQRHKDWNKAFKATKGYLAGSAAGTLIKVTSGFLMFGVFLARVYLWP
jgi:uncharacterized protein YqgC (DUF456 family)